MVWFGSLVWTGLVDWFGGLICGLIWWFGLVVWTRLVSWFGPVLGFGLVVLFAVWFGGFRWFGGLAALVQGRSGMGQTTKPNRKPNR